MNASLRNRRAVVTGVLLSTAAAAACKDSKPPTLPARGAIPDSAEQVMFGMSSYLWAGGLRRAQLKADTALFYDEMTRIELRNMRTVFYTSTGDSNAVMLAQKGTYDTRLQRLDGRGDVRITTVDGRKLTSPHLVYDRIVNQVTSDTSFVFNEPGRTIQGIGLRTDPSLRNVQVLKAASGRAVVGAPAPRSRSGGRPR